MIFIAYDSGWIQVQGLRILKLCVSQRWLQIFRATTRFPCLWALYPVLSTHIFVFFKFYLPLTLRLFVLIYLTLLEIHSLEVESVSKFLPGFWATASAIILLSSTNARRTTRSAGLVKYTRDQRSKAAWSPGGVLRSTRLWGQTVGMRWHLHDAVVVRTKDTSAEECNRVSDVANSMSGYRLCECRILIRLQYIIPPTLM